MARRALPARVRIIAGSAVLATAFGAGFFGPAVAPASADSIQTQIAAAQKQLDALDAQAEAASERYNAARIALAAAQRTAQAAQQRLTQAQATVARTRHAITAFAIAAYTGDPLDSALSITATGNPQEMLDKLATLQIVTENQQQALVDVSAARRSEAEAQATASATLTAAQAAAATVQSDRDQVLAAAAKERQILQTLQAKEAAIIRAAKAAAARAAAERAAAALRARALAEARAASAFASQSTGSGSVVTGSGGAPVAVHWAYKEIGKPYEWGAAGPDSFDCSGLTQYVWAKAGVYLDHYTGSQWNEGRHVSRDQLQPGDLVFFGSDLHHVGIYIGNGNMIEAPHSGADVRISPAFRSDYAGAVRPGT